MRAAPMKDGQNSALVAASACGVNTPAYDGSKSPANAKIPRRNSALAAATAILLTESMKRKPKTHTKRTRVAKRPYATAYAGVVCGSPTRRWAPPTSASPELQTEMLKKATAVSRDRNE